MPTYSGILAIKRNKFESVLVRWMNLEPVIQNEVGQKEKNKYHILTHIYEGILLSHKKNVFESVLVKWMNLEPIIQSEISQKEK